jgi:polar amino acid transport system ATP-binding protein
MHKTAVKLENISKTFGQRTVLRDVSLSVQEGELVTLIGPSGCGKSTLLRCINGLEAHDHGVIGIGGKSLHGVKEAGHNRRQRQREILELRQKVGMVFQSFNLFPHLTVLQNASLGPQVVQRETRAIAEERARKLLDKVGLSEHLGHYPSQLSGGQQQRAAIARALAMQPKVMLYDEPTSALDPVLVDEVLSVMKQLDAEGLTQLVVTHEMRFARDASDRVLFLHSGSIIEDRPAAEMFSSPSDPRTKAFLQNFLSI